MFTLVLGLLVLLVLAVLWANASAMRRTAAKPAKRPEPVPSLFPRQDPDMSYEIADELAVDPTAIDKPVETGGPRQDGT